MAKTPNGQNGQVQPSDQSSETLMEKLGQFYRAHTKKIKTTLAIIIAATAGYGARYYQTRDSDAKSPEEEAARKFLLGRDVSGKYPDRQTWEIELYGKRGFNEKIPNEVWQPLPDENKDGTPENLTRLVVTDQDGKPLTSQKRADALRGKLEGLTFKLAPIYDVNTPASGARTNQ